MIYYIRTLKTGEKCITSYKDQSTAKRVATQESSSTKKSLWDGEMFFDLKTGKYGADASGVGLVSHIKSAGNSSEGGRFAVFSLLEGKPNDLGLRFATYGDANKFIKAVISAYGELFVLEMEKVGKGVVAADLDEEGLTVSDAPPF